MFFLYKSNTRYKYKWIVMGKKKKSLFLYYSAITIGFAYIALTFTPFYGVKEYKLYFRLIFIIPFILMFFYGKLKNKEK